jgi:hypothetical protein
MASLLKKNGTSERANIIIDENQKVAFVKIYPISQLPDIDEIISELGSSQHNLRCFEAKTLQSKVYTSWPEKSICLCLFL